MCSWTPIEVSSYSLEFSVDCFRFVEGKLSQSDETDQMSAVDTSMESVRDTSYSTSEYAAVHVKFVYLSIA